MNIPLVTEKFPRSPWHKSGKQAQKMICKKVYVYRNYLNDKDGIVLGEYQEKCRETGIEVSPDELRELGIFNAFVSSHVRPSVIRDVPCMCLWAEWVRFFLKQMKRFPELILEKEFRDLIIQRFGFDVAEDAARGPVYPGILFAPERKHDPAGLTDYLPG
jgi:hypothetical protein